MNMMLVMFWVKRFLQVIVCVFISLSMVDYFDAGFSRHGLHEAAIWAAIVALLAASLATYWAYKKHCGAIFKQ